MICIIAFVVFAFLGIFSASYRAIAKDAWQCVVRKVQFKPCDTGLDIKLKAEVMRLFKFTPSIGKAVYAHFEAIAWLLVILTVVSAGYLAYGGYNYYYYGNCDGPKSEGFCIFDPAGHNKYSSSGFDSSYTPESLKPANATELEKYPSFGSKDAKVRVVEFGCFACPYTKKAASAVQELKKNYETKIRFIFVNTPLPQHVPAEQAYAAGWCVQQQDTNAFWQYYFNIFSSQYILNETVIREVTDQLAINQTTLQE